MKTNYTLNLLAVVCAGALASCASQPATTRMPVSASSKSDSSLTGKIFREVNSYRRSIGKPELQRHAGLDRLAQEHCEYLRAHRGQFSLYGKNVSHIGFEGRALVARERYKMNSCSENVAAANRPGEDVAPALVRMWTDSKDHAYNLRSSWTYTGIGAVVDEDGTVFSTEIFGNVSNSQLATRDRFNRF